MILHSKALHNQRAKEKTSSKMKILKSCKKMRDIMIWLFMEAMNVEGV